MSPVRDATQCPWIPNGEFDNVVQLRGGVVVVVHLSVFFFWQVEKFSSLFIYFLKDLGRWIWKFPGRHKTPLLKERVILGIHRGACFMGFLSDHGGTMNVHNCGCTVLKQTIRTWLVPPPQSGSLQNWFHKIDLRPKIYLAFQFLVVKTHQDWFLP